MHQHQPLEPGQCLPWFLECQGTHRQGVSSRHPNHSCPTRVTEGLWFNLLRKQICRLTLNMPHSSLTLSCKHRVMQVFRSASCSILLKKCSITIETIQKMFYHSRKSLSWRASPVASCLCELVEWHSLITHGWGAWHNLDMWFINLICYLCSCLPEKSIFTTGKDIIQFSVVSPSWLTCVGNPGPWKSLENQSRN